MEIYFIKNGVETQINNDYVISMAQSGSLFDNQFKLGATLSKCLTLEIDKKAFPDGFDFSKVKVKDNVYSEGVLATKDGEALSTLDEYLLKADFYEDIDFSMRIDSYSLEDDKKYKVTCYDEMIYLNKKVGYDYTDPKTVLEILTNVCASHSLTLNTTDLFGGDMSVTWALDCTERDFVSYVAEINGACAYIDHNILYILPFDSTPQQSINVEDTSGYEVGSKHVIDRVYIELAEATHYYPNTSENETCYLNSDNLLITDLEDESYTIQKTVEHICSVVSGLTFYNLKIDRCYINQSIKTGDFIELVEGDNVYPTIVQLDTTFCYLWKGGYELELDTAEIGNETQVVGTSKDRLKRLQIVVDRNMNTITQMVADVDETYGKRCSTIEQTADGLALTVSKLDKRTVSFKFDSEGAHITSDENGETDKGTNTLIDEEGLKVRNDTDVVASMSANSFQTSNWILEQYNDVDSEGGSIFNIFKGGS